MAEEWSSAQKAEAFETFWQHYPRKVGKHPSRQKFDRLVTSPEVFQAILAYLERQMGTQQWRDIRFVPHPTTVLNQRRWEDDQAVNTEGLLRGKNLPESHTFRGWICDHEPHCGNRETCAVVASRVCPHTPKCSKRTECLEKIVNSWL